jgi:hypothetical protein
VVLNWLVDCHERHGFVHNPRTKGVMNLSACNQVGPLRLEEKSRTHTYQHPLLFKAGVILRPVFLFFITATLMSFTLRETQDRMLQLRFNFKHMFERTDLWGSLFVHTLLKTWSLFRSWSE